MHAKTTAPDLLRRFTPTPLAAHWRVMRRTIRLETNSTAMLEQTRRALDDWDEVPGEQPEFLWRIVCEADPRTGPPWPVLTAFFDESLSFVNIGQRGFLAVDLKAREAVGFLPEELVRDETGFRRPFLAMLFCLTARGLRLTPFSAACVALGGRGLLIFGPPKSGKTTSAFLAGKLGLEFHADQVVFLDLQGGGLRAWGEFWPAVFHAESQHFLLELSGLAQSARYGERTYLYLNKAPGRAPARHGVIPVCCIFLEPQKVKAFRLSPLSPAEFAARLREHDLFQDDQSHEPGRDAIEAALQLLPAYRLDYGSDPATAAIVMRSLLSSQGLLEVRL